MLIPLKDREFQLFQELIFRESRIYLSPAKRELVQVRLSKRLRAKGMSSFKEYYHYLAYEDPEGEEINRMLDVISTHQTAFFREPEQFQFLVNHLPLAGMEEKTGKGEKKIRIWSAGCSTGEEPYSIAMTLYDWFLDKGPWGVGRDPRQQRPLLSSIEGTDPECLIIATDISQGVVERALRGIYPEEKVRAIPTEQLRRHFQMGYGRSEGHYRVKEHLKRMVRFMQWNLFDKTPPVKDPLDLIFCRNVLIYFNKESQRELIQKFYRWLQPGGYLFLGHSESLIGMPHRFQYVQPTVYRKG